MAIVVGKVNQIGQSFVAGDRVMVSVDIKGDNAYPTGGTPITPQMFGLDSVDHFDATTESGGGNLAAYDYANKKLKMFTAFSTEVTAATDLSAKTWRTLVIGKGRAGGVS
jgi:hypothetical protein